MSDQKKKKPNLSFRLTKSPTNHANNFQPCGDDNHSAQGRLKTNPTGQGKSSQRQRPVSFDNVRKIYQEEGRTARNLLKFNVPQDAAESNKAKLPTKAFNQPATPPAKFNHPHSASHRTQSDPRSAANPRAVANQHGSDGRKGQEKRSSGTSMKKDIRARYWAYLFENLRRAIDEIYLTCEADESVVECKEVIMMLDQYTKDFKSLIERLQLLKAFENADESSRPTSLAWEVRKMSPGKSLSSSYGRDSFLPSPTVARSLTFNGPSSQPLPTETKNSWADRVRGVKTTAQSPVPVIESSNQTCTVPNPPACTGKVDTTPGFGDERKSIKNEDNCPQMLEMANGDSEGWETVHRSGKTRLRPQSTGVSISEDAVLEFKRSTSVVTVQQKGPALASRSAQSLCDLNTVKMDGKENSATNAELDNKSSSEENNMNTGNVVKERLGKSVYVLWPGNGDILTLEKFTNSSVDHDDGFSEGKTPQESLPPDNVVCPDKLEDARIYSNNLDNVCDDAEDADGEYEEDLEDLDNDLIDALDTEDSLEHELEKEREEALKTAVEEEENCLKEIAREESLEVNVETEPETEAESEPGANSARLDSSQHKSLDWDAMLKQYEDEYEMRKGSTWGDMVEEAEARTPGRVVHVHEKLSSPSRKRSVTESKKQHEEKQAKAHELREKLLQEKGENLRVLTKRVEEIQTWKNELLRQKRITMEKKLQRVEEKRQILLQMKVRKAHEEDTKASEIAFINTLEAQNKRHEIMSKYQESEARLQDMQEERHRRHKEQAAKEAAVEERRKALEAERLTRLQEMQDKRRQRETDFEQRQHEKEKERLEAARARDREREERLAAINKQKQAQIEELQKKIQHRQDETDRRHKEKLEAIQEKAFRMSLQHHSNEDHSDTPPKIVPYEKKKFCTVCNVLIPSEVYLLSHLRGKKHQQAISDSNEGTELSKQEIENFNLEHISDAPSDRADPQIACERERHKALKKRCRKLRLRMTQRGLEYENTLSGKQQNVESEHKAKLQKIVKELQKYLQSQSSGPWPQNKVSSFERNLGEIGRIMEKQIAADRIAFRVFGGFSAFCQILEAIGQSSADAPPIVPTKSLLHALTVLCQICNGSVNSCQHILLSNQICTLIDLTIHHLNILIPDNYCSSSLLSSSGSGNLLRLPYNPLASCLMETLSAIMIPLAMNHHQQGSDRKDNGSDAVFLQSNDVVSYIISIGLLDKLSLYTNNVRGPIDNDPSAAEFLQHCLSLLTSLVCLTSRRGSSVFEKKKLDDPTQLIVTLKVTQLVGIVSLMYGMLLHTDTPARTDTPPPPLPQHTLAVATMGFRMLNQISGLDLKMLQSSLGEEGTSLEFRHIASYLLWYCHHCTNEELLHEVILCIGYFSILNLDNQLIIQSGQPPTILQQLCSLPFQYFSDPKLTAVLFPTLISCCFKVNRNREILEQELSCALLANFIEEKSLEGQQFTSASNAKSNKTKNPTSCQDHRLSLSTRFPLECWSEAQEYFNATK